MKRPSLMALGLVAAIALATLSVQAAPPRTNNTLVHWQPSFAAAMQVAKAQHKPVLLLQMFGRLDEELC